MFGMRATKWVVGDGGTMNLPASRVWVSRSLGLWGGRPYPFPGWLCFPLALLQLLLLLLLRCVAVAEAGECSSSGVCVCESVLFLALARSLCYFGAGSWGCWRGPVRSGTGGVAGVGVGAVGHTEGRWASASVPLKRESEGGEP